MKLVQIVGPMTGKADWNYPAFHDAERRLENGNGWIVCNPAKNFNGRTDLDKKVYLKRSLAQVAEADRVVVLPGWETSTGSLLEIQLAADLKIPIYELECVLAPHFHDDECRVNVEQYTTVSSTGHGFGGIHVEAETALKYEELAESETAEQAEPWECGDCGEFVEADIDWCPFCYPEHGNATATRANVLAEASRLVTGDRNNQYGPPGQDFQRTAAILTALGYGKTDPEGICEVLEPHDVAIIMSALKLSRLMHMSKKRDSWVDLAGYAACGAEVAKSR